AARRECQEKEEADQEIIGEDRRRCGERNTPAARVITTEPFKESERERKRNKRVGPASHLNVEPAKHTNGLPPQLCGIIQAGQRSRQEAQRMLQDKFKLP